MHESPVRRAAPQHPEVDVNGSNGPFALLNTRAETGHSPHPHNPSIPARKAAIQGWTILSAFQVNSFFA
jgi:hypothetical protein